MKQSRTFKIVTLGCSKNRSDSERMCSLLESQEFKSLQMSGFEQNADLIIVNSCAFTEAARAATLAALKEAKANNRDGDSVKVVLAGCFTSYRHLTGEEEKEAFRDIDAIVTFSEYESLSQICSSLFAEKAEPEPRSKMGGEGYMRFLEIPPKQSADSMYSAILKIGEGCSLNCSFCSIPGIRGALNSRPMNAIVDEARELVSSGAVELNVVSQESTSYGRDLYGSPKLDLLLTRLLRETDARWIRVCYCYPSLISERLIDLFASEERLLPYFDIPLQHINDRILKLMNRMYRRAQVEDMIEKVKSAVPRVQIISSFISGFPSETDEEFSELLNFVQQGHFRYVNSFAFSREKGTIAYSLHDQVERSVREGRAAQIRAVQAKIFSQWAKDFIGNEVDVMMCGYNTDFRSSVLLPYRGRTIWDAPEDSYVNFTGMKDIQVGEIVSTRITGADGYVLHGEVLSPRT
jgi:ribosomal protein S12 methylthiotransferase